MANKVTARSFSELEARMSKAALEESDRIYAKLRKEMALHEIRVAAGLSQEEMAQLLKVNQAQISRVEKRDDSRVSTISRYIAAVGGRLRLLAEINGKMVELLGFDSVSRPHSSVPISAARKSARSKRVLERA